MSNGSGVMMKTVAVILFLSVIGSATAQTQASSYELYSWKSDSGWQYALVAPGKTTRTFEEIIQSGAVRNGTSEIQEELKKLPKGVRVLWRANPTGMRAPANSSVTFKQPSRKRIKRIMRTCEKLGIQLNLS